MHLNFSFVSQRCIVDHRASRRWVKGEKVRGANLPFGTAIATFTSGRHRGHAAIYISQNSTGIQVFDQWPGHPVSQRTINWEGHNLLTDGNSFYVVE